MSFKDLVYKLLVPTVDTAIIPFLYALAFLLFIFGIGRTFFSYSEEKRQEGKKFAVWGLLGLVLLFSVWGVVRLFLNVLTGGV